MIDTLPIDRIIDSSSEPFLERERARELLRTLTAAAVKLQRITQILGENGMVDPAIDFEIHKACIPITPEMIGRVDGSSGGIVTACFIDNDKAYRHSRLWKNRGYKARCRLVQPGCHAVYVFPKSADQD